MSTETIFIGQNITKSCVVGDRLMNRYAVFNGLELPRRIDSDGNVTLLGVGAGADPTLAVPAGGGQIAAGWYAWVAVYASSVYTRPVPVLDETGNYTRGNPSANPISLNLGANQQVSVTVPCIDRDGITHVLLYRSLSSASQAAAEAGPFFYVAQGFNQGASVIILDNIIDAGVGIEVETDNYPPNAYRYAVAVNGVIFVGGQFAIGTGLTCTVTTGSPTVSVEEGVLPFYDGIVGWHFKIPRDTTGGVNEGGLYFVNYVDGSTLQFVDEDNNPFNYNGELSGSGREFTTYLPGFVLRWCKKGEPEAWPTENLINFEGNVQGLAQLPNQMLLLTALDTPAMYILDLNILGTATFKTNKLLLSTEHTTSSHYSLCPVEGRLRMIDNHKGCIIETDGSSVIDISSPFIPEIFKYLSDDGNDIALWHCAYDQKQKLFGAFVTFRNAVRLIDFCIGQYTRTGGWFFHSEKDLLCTNSYIHPITKEAMVLGGTEGPGEDIGGVWGRVWCPNVYSEWIPSNSLHSGTITAVQDARNFTVDTSENTLHNLADGLIGRWVMVCNSDGEYAQIGYIISNTASEISVNRVINGINPMQFYPVPEVGWKFYLGLIECRWGPKKFDFGDPDVLKKVLEIWCCVHNHNEDDPPFVRLYRGFETSYAQQLRLTEAIYLDNTVNQSLMNKTHGKLEPVPRWGMAWYDRSYDATTLHSLSIIFHPLQELAKT